MENKEHKNIFTIHLATYEGNVIGLYGTLQKLEIKYSFNASPGSIKALEIGNKYLFVASYDESIRIYDVAKKFKEIGLLEGHTSTILSMKNYHNILCSCSDDGKILLWKHNTWALIKTMKENKAGVNDIFIDESGRIMLSVSKDSRLFVYDLMKAEKAYQRRFSYNLYKVLMIGHDYICLLSDKDVHVILSSDNSEYKIIRHEQKLCDFLIYKRFLLTSDEKGVIFLWDLDLNNQESQAKNINFQAHKSRIKKMNLTKIDGIDIIVTCSSDGEVKLWDFPFILNQIDNITEDKPLGNQINPIYRVQTNHRITAMVIFNNSLYEKQRQNILQNSQKSLQQETEQQKAKITKKLKKKSKLKKLKKLKRQKEYMDKQKQIYEAKESGKKTKNQDQNKKKIEKKNKNIDNVITLSNNSKKIKKNKQSKQMKQQ